MDTIVAIKDWLINKSSAAQAGFQNKASQADFDELLKIFPSLDDTFKSIYIQFDGQTRNSTVNIFPGFRILSLKEINEERNRWLELLKEEEEIGENQDNYTCYPAKAIRPVFYDALWMPLAADGGGNFIALDDNPDVTGTKLQVIMCGTDVKKRYVLSTSLSDIFSNIYSHLISGDASYSSEEEAILWGEEGLFHTYDILNTYSDDYFRSTSSGASK